MILMTKMPESNHPSHIKAWEQDRIAQGFSRHSVGLIKESRTAENIVRYKKAIERKRFEKALRRFKPTRINPCGWKITQLLTFESFNAMLDDALVFCRPGDVEFLKGICEVFSKFGANCYFDRVVWARLADLAADRLHDAHWVAEYTNSGRKLNTVWEIWTV